MKILIKFWKLESRCISGNWLSRFERVEVWVGSGRRLEVGFVCVVEFLERLGTLGFVEYESGGESENRID